MSAAPDINIKTFRKRLFDRREELKQVIQASAETRSETELDQQRVGRLSRMDAIQQQAMEDETGRRRDQELTRIATALKRVDDHVYGYCTACDGPIAYQRLDNDPATPLCIECASRATEI